MHHQILAVPLIATQPFFGYVVFLGVHCAYGQAGLRRRWIVRLHKILYTLPTAQLLSAFLITVPFTPGFSAIAYTEKWVFLATFVLAVVGLVLLSAPAVQHRLIRPLLDRPRFKSLASRQILAGAVALASALVSGAQLVLSTIFGHVVGSLAAALVAGLIFLLWWWLPRRWKQAGKL